MGQTLKRGRARVNWGGSKMQRGRLALFLVALLFVCPLQSVVAQHPAEDIAFTDAHTGPDFPVGWLNGHFGDGDEHLHVRILYPAMEDGESADMAGNGPFPWVQFFGDDGEGLEEYMLLGSALAERGYIVVVHEGRSDGTSFEELLGVLQTGYEFMESLNQSSDVIIGSFGQIDVVHWGLAGHGHGAASAYGVMPFWNERTGAPGAHPPRAVFGVGADFSSWTNGDHWTELAPTGWVVDVPKPSTGLFITGTLDGVADFNDLIPSLNGSDEFGWHAMQLLGANHYQYQASTSFFEGLDDEDASISQQQQIDRSADHIVPYLDLTLRGDHSSFRVAMNRPDDPNTLADSNAYLEENLHGSHLLNIGAQTFAPANTTTFDTLDTVNWRSNWTLRNGTPASAIPAGWQVTVECTVLGMGTSSGGLTADSEAECLYSMADVAPGEHLMQMRIEVEGAPVTLQQNFTRTDAPLVLSNPVPFIDVEQRGALEVDASLFAFDPDGQEVIFVEVELTGGAVGNFSTSVGSDGQTMVVSHTAPGEYVDGADVRLKIRATGDGVIDEAEVEAMIRVVPVDDPASVMGTVPTQNLVEDGPSVSLLLADYVTDPEGEELIASVSGETQGPYGPIDFHILDGSVTLTPRQDMNGASVLHLLVGDGVNTPVELDVPLYVEPINDPLSVNTSFWDVELEEDSSLALNLSEMAWDIDGDVLFWTIGDGSQNVNVVRAASQILISGEMDYFGFDDSVYLNVSDGASSHVARLNISVVSLPDAPAVTIKELNPVDDRSGGLMWWVYDPDGTIPSEANISVNGTALENLSHSCSLDTSTSTNRCLTFLEYPDDANGTVELRVAVIDTDLGMESVAYLLVNLTGGSDNVAPTNPTDSSEGALPIATLGAISGVILVLIAAIFLFSRRQSSGQVTGFATEETTADVVDTNAGSVGLLARAQAKQ